MKIQKYILATFFVLQIGTVYGEKIDILKMLEGMGESFGVPPAGYVFNFQVWNSAHIPAYVELEGIASFMGGFFQSAKGYYGKKKVPSILEAAGKISSVEYSEPYYYVLYIGDDADAHKHPSYKQYLTQLPLKKNDTSVYYFHTYTNRNFDKGSFVYDLGVEMLGYQDPTAKDEKEKGSVVLSSQLSNLNFFNSSGYDVQVSLTYDTKPYNFTVEKYSHAALGLPAPQEKKPKDQAGSIDAELAQASSSKQGSVKPEITVQSIQEQSDSEVIIQADDQVFTSKQDTQGADKNEPKPPFSLRPNIITFAKYNASTSAYEKFQTMILPDKGFDGYQYTIEIFETADKKMQVGMQGLLPGHYDMPTTPRSRDVTPCPCFFWYKSIAQVKDAEQNGYVDLPGQVWLLYTGADNPVQAKISAGQAVAWNLTRPLVAQGDQYLYFVYVATTDDAIGAKFVEKIGKRLLGKDLLSEYNKVVQIPFDPSTITDESLDVKSDGKKVAALALQADEEVATLLGALGTAAGAIEDTELGVVGYLLGADVFAAKGVGFGRFYYVLSPSLFSVNNLVSLCSFYLDSSKQDTNALTSTINQWMKDYMKDPAAVAKKVEQYLIQNGNFQVSDGKTLKKYGQTALKNIVSGSVSLKYPSLKLSSVTNQYVYDFGRYEQDDWPTLTSLPKIKEGDDSKKSKTQEKSTDQAKSSGK